MPLAIYSVQANSGNRWGHNQNSRRKNPPRDSYSTSTNNRFGPPEDSYEYLHSDFSSPDEIYENPGFSFDTPVQGKSISGTFYRIVESRSTKQRCHLAFR